jgi:monoamine oxidase
LNRRFPDSPRNPKKQEARRRALAYVTGFNAADPNKVGVPWLVQSARAEKKIEGDRAFRSRNGYNDLLDIFRKELIKTGIDVRTETVVGTVAWSRGHVGVAASHGEESLTLSAKRVLITVPLGVLQATDREVGAIRFMPNLPLRKLQALKALQMGKVIRVTLQFRTRFWESIGPDKNDGKTLSHMDYLFTQDDWFPTWWTRMPDKVPILTGWAADRSAQWLSGKSRSFVVERALGSVGSALKIAPRRLASLLHEAWFHDWQNDPFSRGAYSYGGVGADRAQRDLARSVEKTLFFAGEATDIHTGTVHGAIASGRRAASEILRSLQ